MPGTNRAITSAQGERNRRAGESVWSDAVALPFVKKGNELRGRKLAVSFHVAGVERPRCLARHRRLQSPMACQVSGPARACDVELTASFGAQFVGPFFTEGSAPHRSTPTPRARPVTLPLPPNVIARLVPGIKPPSPDHCYAGECADRT